MPSRQDQLHSYQYSLQRVVAALVTHDPDPHRSPLRRAGTTALISLVIAALAVGGAAIYGLLTGSQQRERHGTSQWCSWRRAPAPGTSTSASDQKLHPVLNYTSGLLIANATEPKLVEHDPREAGQRSPLGDPLGIPDAPDSLPGAGKDDLLTGPWSVCTAAADRPAGRGARCWSAISSPTARSPAPRRGTGQALLVRDATDRERSWSTATGGSSIPGNRYDAVLRAFRWGDRQAWPVAAAWINAVPVGPDVRPLDINGFGGQSGVPQAPQIGRLITDGKQWAVALADGAAAVTEVQALLLQTDPDAFTPVTVEGQVFNNLPGSRTRLSDAGDPDGLPSTVPALAATPTRACMTLPVGSNGAGIRINPTVPAGTAVSGTARCAGWCPGRSGARAAGQGRGRGGRGVADRAGVDRNGEHRDRHGPALSGRVPRGAGQAGLRRRDPDTGSVPDDRPAPAGPVPGPRPSPPGRLVVPPIFVVAPVDLRRSPRRSSS